MQGERSLPRVIERRYVLLALDGLNARQSHGLGDATGVRSSPLAKMVLYYKTHLAGWEMGRGHFCITNEAFRGAGTLFPDTANQAVDPLGIAPRATSKVSTMCMGRTGLGG